jgi:3-methylcrotonyl-CoA carboxylase alpha subunit
LALAQVHVVGLHTNVDFLRRVVHSRSFTQADLDTALIERERAVLFAALPMPVEWTVASVAAQCLQTNSPSRANESDPWSVADNWRIHGEASWYWTLAVDAKVVRASLNRSRSGEMQLQWAVDGEPAGSATLQIVPRGVGLFDLALGAVWQRMSIYSLSPNASRTQRAWAVFSTEAHALAEVHLPWADTDSPGPGGLFAPMPGKVLMVMVKPGDSVSRAQPLAVMEAMKMEHTLSAPFEGVVQEVLYGAGDQVAEGAELLRLTEKTSP